MAKHRIAHDKFSQLASRLVKAAPPCLSSTHDWEPTAAALEELNLSLELDNPAALTPLPDASGKDLNLCTPPWRLSYGPQIQASSMGLKSSL